MTAAQSFQKIQRSAQTIKNSAPQRFPEAASFGDVFRQGDLYIQKIAHLPEDASNNVYPIWGLQLTRGESKGSRHILDSDAGVCIYTRVNGDDLTGPVIELELERAVTHPEHGDVILPPGLYAITYQRAFDKEERRRVRD
jgi:hypothetical protein